MRRIGTVLLLALAVVGAALLTRQVSPPAPLPEPTSTQSHVFTPDDALRAALVARAGGSRAVREGLDSDWTVVREDVRVVFTAELGERRVAQVEVPFRSGDRTEVWTEQYVGPNGVPAAGLTLSDGRPRDSWSWFQYPMAGGRNGLTILLPPGVDSAPAWSQRDVKTDGTVTRPPLEPRTLAPGVVEFGPSELPIGFGPVVRGDDRHEPHSAPALLRSQDLESLATTGRGCQDDPWTRGNQSRRFYAVEDAARVAGDPLGQRLLWCGTDGTVLVARTAKSGGAVLVVVDERDQVVSTSAAPATSAGDLAFAWRQNGRVTVVGPVAATVARLAGPRGTRDVPLTPAGVVVTDAVVGVTLLDDTGRVLRTLPVDDEGSTNFG